MKTISIWRVLKMVLTVCYMVSFGFIIYGYYLEFFKSYPNISGIGLYFFLLNNALFYAVFRLGWTVYKENREFGWVSLFWFIGIFLSFAHMLYLFFDGMRSFGWD